MRIYVSPSGEVQFVSGRKRPPLSPAERERVYDLQLGLRCVKLCVRCKQLLPMDLFGADSDRCDPCFAEIHFSAGRVHRMGIGRA